VENYHDAGAPLTQQLSGRLAREPFNGVATLIFALAIAHTLAATKIQRFAHRAAQAHAEHLAALRQQGKLPEGRSEPVSFSATVLHFLGEVEAIFGLWVVPLMFAMTLSFSGHGGLGAGWAQTTSYLSSLSFDEPLFVVIIMGVASTRPVVQLAEAILRQVARLGGETPAAWWAAILTVAPLLGSLITEPAAMTIAALLLGRQFYALKPASRLRYATLGLLFVNVSVGGTLTHFAAPPVLMVASKWGWTTPYMLTHFGLPAVAGIVVSNLFYFVIFRGEFAQLARATEEKQTRESLPPEQALPVWVTATHVLALAWTVANLHHPPLLVGGFLFFLAFTQATAHHQSGLNLRGPLMVGFFLAGLVVHGGLQSWWIQPVLGSLNEFALFLGAAFLTSFNDNAAITYLASQAPSVVATKAMQHAVMEGAVTGGGLTVIANAPNPAGQTILGKHFENGISPLGLLAGAALPTVIVGVCFRVLGNLF